ncbi:hypothetical protein ANN_18812 [Periplaneta americana]|uniref:Reverse transcriptase n=1 Tax=Periplaneta americana TaxID=6978 RepID=A0ABQ8SPS9_PERAM|nr:hypothetical protein ANN_18812 [Periplaneta americana]
MDAVNALFPGCVISRKDDIAWPPRSPDLTVCDFFLWGHFKQSIREEVAAIPVNMLRGVMQQFVDRLEECVRFNGGHLADEQRLRVFDNKVLRKIFGNNEVTGEWRKLHNTELHALCSSLNIMRNIKSRRLRCRTYRVLVGGTEEKRPLARPRRRWEDNIKMDLREVGYDAIDAINWSGRKIRKHLRNDAFQTWTNHTLRGKGVIVYSDLPKANSWVSNRKGLSSSEWTNALKMSGNISAVRAIPGRTLSTTRCRHPDCSELETLGHVLGQCPKGELLINARHHRVRHALATSLKTLNWEIHEEVHCVSLDGSFRRADIIAINGRLKRALVLDPTILFERNLNQATEVDIEKKSIYEPCLPYLSQKYNVPLKQWSVIGLLFGSRGSITKFTWNYLKEIHIPFDHVMSILINIIKDYANLVFQVKLPVKQI